MNSVNRIHPSQFVGNPDLAQAFSINGRGHLSFESTDLHDFAQAHGTRCFVLSLEQVRRNARRLKEAFKYYPGRFEPLYAVKANPLPVILKTLSDEGFGFEVINIHELDHVRRLFPDGGHSVVCNGVSKHRALRPYRESMIEYIFSLQDSSNITVNLDSLAEVEYTTSMCSRLGRKLRVGLRLNPGLDHGTTDEDLDTGVGYSRFGIQREQFPYALKKISECQMLELVELHGHAGSQIAHADKARALERFSSLAKFLSEYAAEYGQKTGKLIESINLGGGLAVNYVKANPGNIKTHQHNWASYTPEEWAQTISGVVSQTFESAGLSCPRLRVEIGRWLSASAMVYLTAVTNKFEISQEFAPHLKMAKSWLITDGSALVDLPDIVLFNQWFEIVNASKADRELSKFYNIGGIACDSGDVFAWGKDETGPRRLPETEVGDVLAMLDVGAYQQALGSRYNLLPRPPTFLVSGEEV
jgi:diaminopimelate decarboxylase